MPKIVVAVSSFFLALSLHATAADQNRNSPASLPADAQSSISAALGHDLPSYRVRARGARLEAEDAGQTVTIPVRRVGVQR